MNTIQQKFDTKSEEATKLKEEITKQGVATEIPTIQLTETLNALKNTITKAIEIQTKLKAIHQELEDFDTKLKKPYPKDAGMQVTNIVKKVETLETEQKNKKIFKYNVIKEVKAKIEKKEKAIRKKVKPPAPPKKPTKKEVQAKIKQISEGYDVLIQAIESDESMTKSVADLTKEFKELEAQITKAKLTENEDIKQAKEELSAKFEKLKVKHDINLMRKLYGDLIKKIEEKNFVIQGTDFSLEKLTENIEKLEKQITDAKLTEDEKIKQAKNALDADFEELKEKAIMQELNEAFKEIQGENLHKKAEALQKKMNSNTTLRTKANLENFILFGKLISLVEEKIERITKTEEPSEKSTNFKKTIADKLNPIKDAIEALKKAVITPEIQKKSWNELKKKINTITKALKDTSFKVNNLGKLKKPFAIGGTKFVLIENGQLDENLEKNITNFLKK